MFVLTRRQIKELRSMLRATVLDQEPKGQWPLVHLRGSRTGVVLESQKGDVALRWQVSNEKSSGNLVFRASVLGDVEGASDTPVTLEGINQSQGKASWQEGPVPRTVTFDTVLPASVPAFPSIPKKLVGMDPTFVRAQREVAKTTAKEGIRTGLTRILLRGSTGQIVATDARQLFVHGGFPFPWSDDVLVPSLKLFLRKKDWTQDQVYVGKSTSHVFLQAGTWTIALGIDTHSKYPDVSSVLPKKESTKARLLVDDEDAAFLIQTLPKLAADKDKGYPITLALDNSAVLRVKTSPGDEVMEIELSRSSVEGDPMRVCVNPANIMRMLELGFREIHFDQPESPLWCEDDNRTYVCAAIPQVHAIGAVPEATRIPTLPQQSSQSQKKERRCNIMPTPSGNGHRDQAPRSEPTLDELVSEAEDIRRLHQEVGTRLSKLVTALKGHRKQSRVLRQAVASIKGLNLGT